VPSRVQPHLPDSIEALEAWEVGMGLPSLPTLVRWADYEVDVPAAAGDIREPVAALLALEALPWEDMRGEKTRHYDLRALVHEIAVDAANGKTRLRMRLRCEPSRVGRPEQVVQALGLPEPLRVHRVRLVLNEASPARDAWRRRGRFVT
jgi:hypothetical protein